MIVFLSLVALAHAQIKATYSEEYRFFHEFWNDVFLDSHCALNWRSGTGYGVNQQRGQLVQDCYGASWRMQSPDSKNIYYDVSIGLSSMVRLGTDDDLKKKYNITGDVSPFASLLIKEDGSDFQIGQSITNGAVNFVPLADDQLTPLLTLGTISINASADAEVANGPVYYLVRAVGQASTPPSNPSSQALRQYLLSQTSVFMKAYVLKGHARLLHWEILGATNEVLSESAMRGGGPMRDHPLVGSVTALWVILVIMSLVTCGLAFVVIRSRRAAEYSTVR